MKRRYRVSGSIMKFGKCIGRKEKETVAESPQKAKNNAIYRVKKDLNLSANTRITWGSDVKVEELD